MKASQFKTELKSISTDLKGMTLKLMTKYSSIPYKSLKTFGNAILEQESYGNSFNVTGVYTANGIVSVRSFEMVMELIKSGVATGVLFRAFYQPVDRCEAMQLAGSLD
jgi:hypothetical protein